MYCPRCGQERISEATNFCSRCGFLLTVTSELVPTGGMLPPTLLPAQPGSSPRSRGVRRGIFLLLLALVVFPVLGIFSVFVLRAAPWPAGVALFVLGGGALLRIAYALMFESKTPVPPEEGWPKAKVVKRTLPPHQAWPGTEALPTADNPQLTADPNAEFGDLRSQFALAGKWRDTNPLEPASVTENTTKLLEKDSDPPV